MFEIFKAPRSGDFSAARIYRYRTLTTGPNDRVLARFDDGAVAVAERKLGAGRVIALTSTLDDSYRDLPLKPVYLPLVHQLVKYLGQVESPRSWLTVGQVVDVSALTKARANWLVVTPSGKRVTSSVRSSWTNRACTRSGPPEEARPPPQALAVNIDPAESDLTPIDPAELVAAVTGRATQVSATPVTPTETSEADVKDAEKRQALWWYLLLTGLLLLAVETVVSNRLSQVKDSCKLRVMRGWRLEP